MTDSFFNGRVVLHPGDSREVLAAFPDNHFDSVVCDPPYALVSIVKRFGSDKSHLDVSETKDLSTIKAAQYKRLSGGFMGQTWDTGETAFAVTFWAEVYRVLKPGGHVVAASGTRTVHRLALAIEDAGFEIRDQLYWLYGSGFPKSHDVSKGIDKAAGATREVVGQSKNKSGISNKNGDANGTTTWDRVAIHTDITAPATDAAREWEGWGTALKPACEPWVLARKPLGEKTIAANVLKHGTSALNIGACRIGEELMPEAIAGQARIGTFERGHMVTPERVGRWPANVLHDGSAEVVAAFPETTSGELKGYVSGGGSNGFLAGKNARTIETSTKDSGSAARFFYSAKADADDRLGSKHPTVKPVDLMQYLVRLVTPKGGLVLDPFAGTGTTGEAAWREGMRAVLVEREPAYCNDIRRRMTLADSGPDERKRESLKANGKAQSHEDLPLFGGE